MTEPLSDERIVQIKRMMGRREPHHDALTPAGVVFDLLAEVDRLRAQIKQRVPPKLVALRRQIEAARAACADPEHTGLQGLDELLAFINGTGWAEAEEVEASPHSDALPLDREAFLQQAVIALGAQPQAWQQTRIGHTPGDPALQRWSDRPPHECAQRALALWNAYAALDRTGARARLGDDVEGLVAALMRTTANGQLWPARVEATELLARARAHANGYRVPEPERGGQ